MKILHISDTHYMINNENEWGINHQLNFELFLKQFSFNNIDMILHTGDITNDGGVEDYYGFFSLIADYIPENIPIHYTLGNHDNKTAFNKAMNIKYEKEAYYYSINTHNYRFIFLDTGVQGLHHGVIEKEQAEWLKQELSTNYVNGTIIVQHHPYLIGWDSHRPALVDKFGTLDKIINSDVIAIFSGHLHMNRVTHIKKVTQYSANPLSFGINNLNGEHWITDRIGYGIAEINNQIVDYYSEIFDPRIKLIAKN